MENFDRLYLDKGQDKVEIVLDLMQREYKTHLRSVSEIDEFAVNRGIELTYLEYCRLITRVAEEFWIESVY